jgi:hypothetical protein
MKIVNGSNATHAQSRSTYENNDGSALCHIGVAGSGCTDIPAASSFIYNSTNTPINFYTNNTHRVAIQAAGCLETVGGLHVGGSSDPGTDNLIVDGTSHIKSYISLGASTPASRRFLYVNGLAAPAANQSAYGVWLATGLDLASSGTHPSVAQLSVSPPYVNSGTAAVTTAITVYIEDEPQGGFATSNYALLVANGKTQVKEFACNGATPQGAYASGGALNAYATGAFGLDSDANMSALHAMVVKIRAALVANGTMS